MERIIARLNEEAAMAFEKAGLDTSFAKITVSNRPDLCEYQCNGAMAAAKTYHKAPIQIAQQKFLSTISGFKDVFAVKITSFDYRRCHYRTNPPLFC